MITVKSDPKLVFPDIEVPMTSEGETNNMSGIRQTNVTGILVPLIRFNNQTIDFQQVKRMTLINGTIPELRLTFEDYAGVIKSTDTPSPDNVLYLQILPPFDDAYKKICLSFYVTNIKIRGTEITISASYNIPGWYDNKMKPYGLLSTYELFENVANEYGLGFCSNMENSQDERWIYNPNNTPNAFLNKEIEFSGNKEHVFEWWIDLWNNLNLVDVYKEYNEILSDEDMMIWISDSFNDASSPDVVAKPMKRPAVLCNHMNLSVESLFFHNYVPKLKSGAGTDINFEVFSMNDLESTSALIQNGDVHKSVIMEYQYGGEVFGDFDYLTQRSARGMFLNKINSQTIEVTLYKPQLGLIKGGHVNVWWFDTNNVVVSDIDNSQVESNIPLPDNIVDGDTTYTINKSVSGQYYISNILFEYNVGKWAITYTLSRPADQINRLNEPSNESFMQ